MRWKIRFFGWALCFIAGFFCGARKDTLWQTLAETRPSARSLLLTSASLWNQGCHWVGQASENLNAVSKRVWNLYKAVRDNTSPPTQP